MLKKLSTFVFGLHAVTHTLRSPYRRHKRLFITQSCAASLKKKNFSLPPHLVTHIVSPHELSALVPQGSVHQGVVLETTPLPSWSLEAVLEQDVRLLVALDQVTDPHNVGAVVRSCAAFGVDGLILTQRHSPSVTGTLAKVACGALEYVRLIYVPNLARSLRTLWNAGFDVVGLAQEAPRMLHHTPMSPKVALVFGSEADGLRQLTRRTCSQLASLPTQARFPSLNVSNAVAASLYGLTIKAEPTASRGNKINTPKKPPVEHRLPSE